MHVLVVGGAGYIGSHVALDLLNRGHKVTVYDDLSTGREENLFDEALFVRGDIQDGDALDLLMSAQNIDAVIHLAALKAAGDSMNEPERYAHHNIVGSINLLNCMTRHDIKKFVFSSSAAVYGNPEYLPMDEKHPIEPTNFYGFTKLQIERHLQWYSQLKGLRFASLRYFNAAGYDPELRVKGLEINPKNLIPIVMEVAMGTREKLTIFGNDYDTTDGTCIRDYVHVNDLADAHSRALEYLGDQDKDLIVNLGSETGHSVLDVVHAAGKVVGREVPHTIAGRRAGDPTSLVAASAKARELLQWEPRFSDLETLLSSSWDVYRNQ